MDHILVETFSLFSEGIIHNSTQWNFCVFIGFHVVSISKIMQKLQGRTQEIFIKLLCRNTFSTLSENGYFAMFNVNNLQNISIHVGYIQYVDEVANQPRRSWPLSAPQVVCLT